MTPDQRLARLTTAFLRSSTSVAYFGWLLCLLAGLGALEAATQRQELAMILHALALSIGFALAWQSLRVRFDIHAFELMADEPEGANVEEHFDRALQQLGLRNARDSRTLAQRAAATRKLVRRLAYVVIAQFLFVIAGLIARYVP